jgi:hypothetical protein
MTFIKVGRMKWDSHVARVGQHRPVKRILNTKPEEKEASLN